MDTSLDDAVDARCAAMSFSAFSLVLHATTKVNVMKGARQDASYGLCCGMEFLHAPKRNQQGDGCRYEDNG